MRKIMNRTIHRVPTVRRLLDQRDNLLTDNGVLQLEKGNLEAEIRALQHTLNDARAYFAHVFIKGSGIEIGPSYLPVPLPKKAKVRYVDHATNDELIKRYPELKHTNLAPIHVVDDAEKLTKFKAGSLDFIIANHFMEHCLDPIGTVLTMCKKLRKGGVLFFAIPDKRYTFDSKRPITSYEHLLEEHHRPTFAMKFQHYLEASEFLDHQKGKHIEPRARELLEIGYSIHYHVWTQYEMTEMFTRIAKEFNIDLEIEALQKNGHEIIYVLRKEPEKVLRNVRTRR